MIIISLIILLIVLLIVFYSNTIENFTSTKSTNAITTSTNSKKQKCAKYIIVKDNLSDYIDQINNKSINKNLLKPKNLLPYNLNNTGQYNILNNSGIKYRRKKESYLNNINNNNPISFNSTTLLKNYDNVLQNTFYTNNSTPLEYPKLYIINNDTHIQWRYDPKYLNDVHFYLYFKYLDNISSNLMSLKLTDDFEHEKFNININHNHTNYLGKLEYKGNKNIKLFIVIKKNNKIILKSNEIKIKLNNNLKINN
jgi:hypothetical protein